MMDFWKGTVTPRDWAAVGIILGVTVLLAVAFYVVVYKSQNQQYAQLVAENRQLAAKLQLARDTEQNIDGLRAEAEQMQRLVKQFEDRLPNTEEIQTLLRQFESLAGEIGLLVELSKDRPEGGKNLEVIPYRVKARGTFHQIATFVNRLERYQRYLKISELDIGKAENGIATASFRLSTFRFLQPSEGSAS